MSTETIRLIRDGEKGGRGYGGGGRGRVYTYRYTVTTRMTSALRWAAMRAILMFHNCERQSHKTVSTDHNFWRERRAGADSNGGSSAYQPNALPLGQTGSLTIAESPQIVFIQTAQTMTASSPPPPPPPPKHKVQHTLPSGQLHRKQHHHCHPIPHMLCVCGTLAK